MANKTPSANGFISPLKTKRIRPAKPVGEEVKDTTNQLKLSSPNATLTVTRSKFLQKELVVGECSINRFVQPTIWSGKQNKML